MASFSAEFKVDSSAAENSIKRLREEIRKVTKNFEEAEIGSKDFVEAARQISNVTKEYNDARNAVVNIDKAYRNLNKAIEANFAIQTKAVSAASKYHKDLLQIAEDSFRQEDRLRDKNFQAEQDDWDRRLAIAVSAKNKIAAQQKAIMDFRAGMGARGAIPEIASPIRGGINYPGFEGGPPSPGYIEAMEKAQKDAARQAKSGGGVQVPTTLQFQPFSLAYYEDKLRKLKNEARLISPDTDKWRSLNQEILKAERGVNNIQKRQRLGPSGSQRLGAAGGAFLYGGGLGGGVGSALGGIAGGLAGGVPGAFAGAAVGQIADNLGQSLAAITSQAAKVQQLQRGLALASIDAKDFAEAQAAVADTSAKLFVPIEQVTKSFSQLRVNTKQYGMSVEETKKILEGTILAVSAVGGSAEDVDGALRAVVQILSKGSVQAEELRGQLGERFPGAVVKFAQANKLSFEELQKGLEQGQIGIKEFVAFAEKNYEDYAEFSKKLATAPEFAGRRLQVALEQLGIEFGSLFGDVGANIQDGLAEGVRFLSEFIKQNRAYLKQFIDDWGSIIGPIVNVIGELLKVIIKFSVEVGKVFQNLFSLIRQSLGMANIGEARARLEKARKATAGKPKPKDNQRGGGAFTELSQAEQAYRDLGGDAAFNRQSQTGPSDLTYGGPGAGMSLDRTGGAGAGSKGGAKKELQDYIRNEQDFLRQIAQIGQNRLALTAGLSAEELNILQASEQFRADSLINEQQLIEGQRDAAKYSIATRDQYLKDLREKYENEKILIQQRFDEAVYAPFLAIEKQLISENEALEASLKALQQGRTELTAEERIGLAVNREIQAQEAIGIKITPSIIKDIQAKAKAQDELNRKLSYGKTMLALNNQLALAGILDPRMERRAQIKQENPGLNDEQVEAQASLEERIEAVKKAKEDLRNIASSIGNAFGEAFKGIITGSSSVRDALAGMFQSIADSFADMVAQMIAEWLRAQLVKGFASLFPGAGVLAGAAGAIGGGLSSGFSAGASSAIDTSAAGWGAAFNTSLQFANGGIASGGFRAFADGGIVSGPTLGLVGEGRYNEAIIPLPDGKSVPVDLGDTMGGTGGEISTNIVINVNNGQMQSEGGGNASSLGRKMEGAVKQVIVNELRPGGVLAGRR